MRRLVVHRVHGGHNYVTFMRKSSCKVPRLEFKLSSGLCNHQHKIQEQHLHHCRIRLQETINDVKVCFQILIRNPSGIHTLRKGATLPCPRRFCHAWFMKTSKAGSSSGSQTSCLSNLGSNPRRDPTFPDVYNHGLLLRIKSFSKIWKPVLRIKPLRDESGT